MIPVNSRTPRSGLGFLERMETPMTPTPDRARQLQARRDELTARMIELDAELDSHDSKDWEDLATEREADEVLEDLGQAAQAEIARIDAALRRIADGEYGYCVTCGERIAEERLDLVPATPFCKTHAR